MTWKFIDESSNDFSWWTTELNDKTGVVREITHLDSDSAAGPVTRWWNSVEEWYNNDRPNRTEDRT